jgi:hypothetical protein
MSTIATFISSEKGGGKVVVSVRSAPGEIHQARLESSADGD